MLNFNNSSKEYQDILVHTLIPTPGFFLDIGMGDPINGNNSYFLELNGWSGFMFDQTQKDIDQANSIRKNTAIQVEICLKSGQHVVDYIGITQILTWIKNQKKKIKKIKC